MILQKYLFQIQVISDGKFDNVGSKQLQDNFEH